MKQEYRSLFIVCIVTLLMIAGCNLTTKIKSGEMAYERKQYAVAITMLQDEYETTTSVNARAKKAFLLGKSYQMVNNNKESIRWLEDAVSKNYGPEALNELAFAYKSDGNYNKAIGAFESLINLVGSRAEIFREINVCKEAIRWIRDHNEEYRVYRSYANSAQADYAPAYFEDDYVVFTSDRGTAAGSDRYNWTGNKFSDLFIMRKDGSGLAPFDLQINTSDNEGTAWFSKDNNEMFFTRCVSDTPIDAFCKIYYSQRYSGTWSEPEVLPFTREGINYGQPTLIENDSVLVFSTKIDAGVGDYDLFYSIREEDNSWSAPERFPDIINTNGNELFPTGDGDTLYFSSDFHPGLGGLDIFKTYLDENKKWTVPKRMPVPINSPSDDFSFVVDRSVPRDGDVIKRGFFTSSRDGMGDDDLYVFEKIRIEREEDPIIAGEEEPKITTPVGRNITYYVAGRVLEPVYDVANDPNTRVIDYRPVDLARVRIRQGDETVATYTTDRRGIFVEEVDPDKDYAILAGKSRYLNNTENFTTRNVVVSESEDVVTINVDVIINRIFMNREIDLQDIYYDLDRAEIREDAKPPLDKLAKMLADNPDIRIQLSSHTDCRADDEYNLDLSQRRAISAVMYLISNGIDKERLVPRGYGKTQLRVDCPCQECTEEEHQQNRRTTFKIII